MDCSDGEPTVVVVVKVDRVVKEPVGEKIQVDWIFENVWGRVIPEILSTMTAFLTLDLDVDFPDFPTLCLRE